MLPQEQHGKLHRRWRQQLCLRYDCLPGFIIIVVIVSKLDSERIGQHLGSRIVELDYNLFISYSLSHEQPVPFCRLARSHRLQRKRLHHQVPV